ncbi:MAG: hypothetical protein ACOY94_09805 [Bacillota bacterium]
MAGEVKGPGLWPGTGLGRVAVGVTGVAVLLIFLLPWITQRYREVYPIVDTWVMPAVLMVFLDAAAVLHLVAVWRRGERSPASIMLLVITLSAALFLTAAVIGGAVVPA